MRTVPSGWDSFQFRTDVRYGFIVQLWDGTTSRYFATQEIEKDVGVHIYGLLIGLSGIKHKFNPFNRTWSIGNVTVVLDNSPYRKNTNGNWIRPSDDLTNITGRFSRIYIFCGELDNNSMIRYKGIVSEEPTHNQQTCTIRLSDDTAWENTYLPNRKVSDVFTDHAREVSDKLVPLVYGDFTYDPHIEVGDFNGADISPGLVKGQFVKHTNDNEPGRFIVAAHKCFTIATAHYQESSLKEAGEFNTYSIHNALTKQYVNIKTNIINIDLLPDNQNWVGYNFDGQDKGSNPENTYDLDSYSAGVIKDNVSDDGYRVKSENRVGFAEHEAIANLLETAPSEYAYHYNIRFKASAYSGIGIEDAWVRLYYDADANDVPLKYDWNVGASLIDGAWHYAGWDATNFGIGRPLLIAIHIHSLTYPDSILNNQSIFRFFAMELRIQYSKTRLGADTDLWFGVKGREFGSWIDASGRSNHSNVGDLIEDPAFVIESLLRDELGFTDSDIDVVSFDRAANYLFDTPTWHPSTPINLNLHNGNKAKVENIIKQICEQATFAFTYTSEGKIRLIDFVQSNPTAVRTIPYSHIINGKITIGSANDIINRLNVESRYWQQIKEYRDKDIFNDAPSQAFVGVREQSVSWPNLRDNNITGDPENVAYPLQTIAEHYVKADTGLWSNPHDEIIFETAGVMYSDLEVGDWIEIDAITVDPHIKPHGVSWSGRLYMITETVQLLDRTRITAVKL